MIHMESETSKLVAICPECKNQIDLSRYPSLVPNMVIECDHCGMTLLIKGVEKGEAKLEIVDEGK